MRQAPDGRTPHDPPITSPQNPRLKAVWALRDRRDRERSGQFLVDGAREIRRAIAGGVQIDELFVCETLCQSDDCHAVLQEARRRGIRATQVGERAFGAIAFGDRAEGVVAIGRTPAVGLAELQLPSDALVVVLEGVEKPGNLGAVLRSADGAGADALIVADGGTDLFNPNAIRASVGMIFGMRLAAAPTTDVIAWLGGHGVRIYAARVDGARPYTDVDMRGPTALVLGSEAGGLSAAWSAGSGGRREANDAPKIEAISLPMHGMADSLNVSVAAAILLYEARRQRDTPPPPTPTPTPTGER